MNGACLLFLAHEKDGKRLLLCGFFPSFFFFEFFFLSSLALLE